MQLAAIFAQIWSFCLMLGDFPALFQSQQQSHEVQLSIVDHSTTLSRPHKYKCPKPNSDFTPFLVNSCNSPSNRQKWCYGYDINTDFEEVVPNTGVTRKFTLVLTNANYCGDGYAVDGTLINGSYPGPMLEGNWGDWFEITVINELTNCNGTAIHWHGVRQWKTVWEDGVGGVTQCPIPPKLQPNSKFPTPPPTGYTNKQTYRWRATQYGASWYHSHFSLQYANGALGPLLIHGPATANYDIDKGPLLITDWYHRDAFEVYHNEVVPGGNATVLFQPPAKLMNGVGRFVQGNQYNNDSFPACEVGKGRCIDHGSIYKTEVVKGKRHRFRIMNTSTSLHFTFWIEGHTMTVIGADFVPIKPYTAKVLNVAIGQRYDVIIHANADLSKSSNFWIRMRDCGNYCLGRETCPPDKSQCFHEECRTGILSYDLKDKRSPDLNSRPELGDKQCKDAALDSLKPIVPRTIPDPYRHDDFKASINNETGDGLNHWTLAENGETFIIDWRKPALLLIQSGYLAPDDWKLSYVPVMVNSHGKQNKWKTFVIQSNWTDEMKDKYPGAPEDDPDLDLDLFAVMSAHPIHLHGHDFAILYQSEQGELYDEKNPPPLILKNPPRRDVVMLPKDGYVILAFRIDNPGSWIMHCHIAWHASNGFAVQFVEDQDQILPLMANNPEYPYILQQLDQQCKNWKWWYSTECRHHGEVARQDDSGI